MRIHWVNAEDIIEKHGVTKDQLDMFAYDQKKRKSQRFVKKIGGFNYYNEKELLKVKDDHARMYHENTKNYWWLVTKGDVSEYRQSIQCHEWCKKGVHATWNAYISQGMWRPVYNRSILHVNSKAEYIKIYNEWSNMKIKEIKEERLKNKDQDAAKEKEIRLARIRRAEIRIQKERKEKENMPDYKKEGFDNVDQYFDYHEALKFKDQLEVAA